MPITPTEKIWMDGELVDWDDAPVHVLTHALHYGSGVFEGIRAYATAGPGGVPPAPTTSERLFDSAKILMIEVPFTRRRARRGHQLRWSRRTGWTTAATSARSSTSATARSGSTRCPAR